MRNLVIKQKLSSKKKNCKSNSSRGSFNNGKYYTDKSYYGHKSIPNNSSNIVNRNSMNSSQNINNYERSSIRNSTKTSPSNSRSFGFKQKNTYQNGINSPGYVTDALRSFIEFKISQNQKVLLYFFTFFFCIICIYHIPSFCIF